MTTAPAVHAREQALARLREHKPFDLAVIGGGATGLGVALDAAARGLAVVLLEAHDFAQGTSSRATKLVHGGVRYLAQGDFGLVREALRERAAILANAPHLAQRLGFVVPAYGLWQVPFYGLGLKAYGALAGARGLGPTRLLGAARTRALLPGVRAPGLRGGVQYWDGQFDDARLAVLLARTAQARGALVLNRMPVQGLMHDRGRVAGVVARDEESGERFEVRAGCVVNATGVWVDAVRAMDHPDATAAHGQAGAASGEPSGDAAPVDRLVEPSQGVHLVVDRAFLPGANALLVPRTRDARVLFAVPWLGKTVLGTTDTPRPRAALEPEPLSEEVDFILGEAARVLARAPTRADVRSAWVGLRPLVRPGHGVGHSGAVGAAGSSGAGGSTQAISREHTVLVSGAGLVTVTGGKWTTYRAMAEDVLSRCMRAGLLPRRAGGVTEQLRLLGAAPGRSLAEPPGEHLYGSEAAALRALPGAQRWLAHDEESGAGILSEAMVRFAVRQEMARSVEDVLARRSRLLFLDARQAARVASGVGAILADELGPGFDARASVQALLERAAQYLRLPGAALTSTRT